MKCNWFIQIRGMNPNTGQEVDEWGCSVAWLPHLLIENANQTRQAGAATESFRNEFVKSSEASIRVMAALTSQGKDDEVPMKIVHVKDDDDKNSE